jgi:hypothetical protein
MTAEFEIKDFKILSTGVDGGHHYISTVIDYKGNTRNLTVIFKSKTDEKRITTLNVIKVKGQLQDEGSQFSLTLLESEIIQ